jgi:hypothetical protein
MSLKFDEWALYPVIGDRDDSPLHAAPPAPPLRRHDYEILAALEPAKQLDVEILRRWIQHCDSGHGNHC